jgi:hypothetical protein
MKSLEKKPINGGTPAIEKSSIVSSRVKKELKLKPLKEYRVLNCVIITLNIVQNKVVRDRL